MVSVDEYNSIAASEISDWVERMFNYFYFFLGCMLFGVEFFWPSVKVDKPVR